MFYIGCKRHLVSTNNKIQVMHRLLGLVQSSLSDTEHTDQGGRGYRRLHWGPKNITGDLNGTHCSIDRKQSKEMKKRESTSLKPFPGMKKVVSRWSEPTKRRPGSPHPS